MEIFQKNFTKIEGISKYGLRSILFLNKKNIKIEIFFKVLTKTVILGPNLSFFENVDNVDIF